MYSAKDMKDMIDMYSQFVEDKMLTKGRERLIENALGLTGEAGEVSEKIKKLFRDKRIDDDAVLKELGDVLFYTVALSNIFGGSLIKIIELNMEKLNDRVKKWYTTRIRRQSVSKKKSGMVVVLALHELPCDMAKSPTSNQTAKPVDR